MNFTILDRNQVTPISGVNNVYLEIDRWNDYSFVTLFYLSLHDELGKYHKLGSVKIGFKGQDTDRSTHSTLNRTFTLLPSNYFSLGTDLDYYNKIRNDLSQEVRDRLLSALQDVVYNENKLQNAIEEDVFSTSLLRDVSLSTIKGQFRRVLEGGVPLTDFEFSYKRPQEENFAGIDLSFQVKAESKPSTNIHAIIGRNGAGKTTLFNKMIESVTNRTNNENGFYTDDSWERRPINSDYFSSLVSVSFSAFDPFVPPAEQPNPALGTCYYYIGLKEPTEDSRVSYKSLSDLHAEFLGGIKLCRSQPGKKDRWIKAIQTLESDNNFSDMGLTGLISISSDELEQKTLSLIEKMSSGHEVVLITITKLVATVEEKTLVLIDEPESHLHPPLLSAFIRALSELLFDRNGVAIIATHSPVALQEIPKSCVWRITRSRFSLSCSRPDVQTFGENVGVLTRDIFGLEVIKSGFHQLLEESVENGDTFDEVMVEYDEQLGFEAQAILRAMILHRDGNVER